MLVRRLCKAQLANNSASPLLLRILNESHLRSFSNGDVVDHYKTLGVSRSASAKEIKTAFYELSKKHHPDANPQNDSQEFPNIVAAYEVLGSQEKKRIYDATLSRSGRGLPTVSTSSPGTSTKRQKAYTDLDIDYKDFEHFQRSTRRKRASKSDYEIPQDLKEFLREETTREKKNDGSLNLGANYSFKDTRAYEREQEERRLAEEIEEMKRKAKHPLPKFEELLREQEREKRRWTMEKTKWIAVFVVFTLLTSIAVSSGPGRR